MFAHNLAWSTLNTKKFILCNVLILFTKSWGSDFTLCLHIFLHLFYRFTTPHAFFLSYFIPLWGTFWIDFNYGFLKFWNILFYDVAQRVINFLMSYIYTSSWVSKLMHWHTSLSLLTPSLCSVKVTVPKPSKTIFSLL